MGTDQMRRAQPNPEENFLGPLEARVMAVLWSRGVSTAREVLETINQRGARPLAYTTVNTILVRLRDKGYAIRNARGRQFAYSAAHDRDALPDAVGRRDLERLILRYGAPAVARFAEDLANEQPEMLRRLRVLADKGRRDQ